MKNFKNNFLESIGNTPLIKLKAASEVTGCHIYGKAEYLNPGGSVKDRAALALIKDAQEKKLISKGGIVVEGTAGNTGIGLCLLGNSLGYQTIIVMNDNQTQEKKDTLKNIGADLRLVPAKPYKDDIGLGSDCDNFQYDFFNCTIDSHGRYLTEDWSFCRSVRKIGKKIWADLSVDLEHSGSFRFQPNLKELRKEYNIGTN